MARAFLIAALAGAMFAAAPAYAQEPELDGAPPPLQIPKPAPKPQPKPSAPATQPTSAAKLKAEEARLAAQAADLAAEKARLDARAAALAAEERRLANLRTQQEADYARKLAALETRPPQQTAAAAPAPPPLAEPRSPRAAPYRPFRITYEDARSACTYAGMSEAVDRDFDSARYDRAPRWDERDRELRGVMRLDDRRGYVLVDTVCALDDNGDVIDFALLR